MPSELETAILRTRSRFNEIEDPARRQMAATYQRVTDRIQSELKIVDIASGGNPEGWRLFRQQRLQRLLTQAESEFARFSDDGMRIIGQERVMAVRGGAAQAWELMGASGVETAFSGRINTAAVERVMAATYDGPLRKVLDGYGARGSEAIERLLLQGISTGEGGQSITRRIMRELGGKGNRSRIEALTRTEGMRGFRAGIDEQYKEMGHLIQGYRWVAAKSLRTCLACLSRDGQVQKTPWDQFHVQCRCVNSPVPIGSKMPYETGPEWLAKQHAEKQRKMFATTKAYEAYRAGDVTLDNFVGVSRSRVWGDAVFQKSGKQAMERAK